MRDYILAVLQWAALIIVRVPLIVLGLFVVAAAIPFRQFALSTEAAKDKNRRAIWNLPRWAWLWGNDFDGLLGDKRGWWDENCDREAFFGLLPYLRTFLRIPVLRSDHFLAMWWWAAVRNPVNNLRFVPGISCPVSECLITYKGSRVVEDKPKLSGWQFVKAERIDGISVWYGFYLVHAWSDTRAFVIRLGYKIKPDHIGRDEPQKGMTFKVNLAHQI